MQNTDNKIELKNYNKKSDEPKYSKEKWKKIMDTTQMNYNNMIKRLSKKNKMANFILIYYSIFLIVNTLTCKYFHKNYNAVVAEYSSIILSVVLLAYSIINSNANYNIRVYSIENSLNEIKNLKRKIQEDEIESVREEYNKITDKTERREDSDFFHTVIQLSKSFEINWWTKKKYKNFTKEFGEDEIHQEEVIKGYLSEIFVTKEIIKIAVEYIWYLVIVIIPILIMFICVKIPIKE